MKNLPKNFRPSFIYPEIKEQDRLKGAVISGPIINPTGDHRQFLPPDENQGQNNVEPSSCYIEAQQASIATIQEETFGIKDRNYSARFNALLSGGTEDGGDPIKGALSIKKDGLIPQSLMDWRDIFSWSDYHSWKSVNKDECITEGKKEVALWDKSYKIVAEIDNPVQIKYLNLHKALLRAPVPISVTAWYEREGKYYKPEGMRDNHLVEAVYIDANNSIWIRDTYAPYIKVLEPYFNFEFAMYWVVNKRSPEEQLKEAQLSLIDLLQKYVVKLLQQIYKVGGEIITGIFSTKN